MKTLILTVVVMSVFASLAVADVYVKEQVHTDGYYYGGRVTEPSDRTTKTWIGDDKLSYISDNRIIIFDLSDSTLTFINRTDSTYATTTLPMEWGNLCDEQTAARVQMFPMDGTFKETGETKELDGRLCKEYEVNSYIPYEGTRYNETDTKVWVTTDVPFDVEMYNEINSHNLKLQNFGDEFRERLVNIKGLRLHMESEIYLKGSSYKSSRKVVEILEKEPPTDVYSPPAGFTQKEKLGMADLRGAD